MGIFDMKFFRFLGFKKKPNAPWSKYYKKREMNLHIPDMSLYGYYKKHCIKKEVVSECIKSCVKCMLSLKYYDDYYHLTFDMLNMQLLFSR